MKQAKQRLDTMLCERGFYESRQKAQAAIMAGEIRINGQLALKPGTKYPESIVLEVCSDKDKYVSRGGLKLEKAVDEWTIDLQSKICMDIGASTGGFTDLMLRRGASFVYAIDVGYGQLDWKLRNDSRVINIERTNIRYLDRSLITRAPDFICIDVSFISLELVLPVASDILKETGQIIALIKPQFEAGREQVSKGGIIRDESVRLSVIEKVRAFAEKNTLLASDVIESPIKGAKGNIEYLMRMQPVTKEAI